MSITYSREADETATRWITLESVYCLARAKQVSFALLFAESDDSWYFTVSSCAPSEDFVGKNRSLAGAFEDVLRHLRAI